MEKYYSLLKDVLSVPTKTYQEEKMIEFAKKNNEFQNCNFEVADIKDYEIDNCSIITSY